MESPIRLTEDISRGCPRDGVRNGPGTPAATDAAGNPLWVTKTWKFTVK